jgi:hypothetical protein
MQDHFDESNVLDQTFWQRAVSTGMLSDDLLSGLLAYVDVVLLPIVDGGGSNLKTAEAILSGKKIVATTFAFRGFEEYMDLPNVYIATTPSSFRETITRALAAPFQERTADEIKRAERVQWQYSLQNLVEKVATL